MLLFLKLAYTTYIVPFNVNVNIPLGIYLIPERRELKHKNISLSYKEASSGFRYSWCTVCCIHRISKCQRKAALMVQDVLTHSQQVKGEQRTAVCPRQEDTKKRDRKILATSPASLASFSGVILNSHTFCRRRTLQYDTKNEHRPQARKPRPLKSGIAWVPQKRLHINITDDLNCRKVTVLLLP